MGRENISVDVHLISIVNHTTVNLKEVEMDFHINPF